MITWEFAVDKIHEHQFEMIDQSPYSPDLVPSEYLLYFKHKSNSSDEKLIESVNANFAEQGTY